MAQELEDIVSLNAIPHMHLIHDCVDTGATVSLTASTPIDFPCNCAVRNYKNNDGLFDSANSSFKNHINDGLICFKITLTLNGLKDSYCTCRVYVPHPTFGDINIAEHDFILHKNNTDTRLEWSSFVYMGTDAEAKTYGFKIELTPSANMSLKARSILVMA